MKKGRRPRRRPRLKLSDKAGPDQCPVPGENALFPAQIAGFLAVSRFIPCFSITLSPYNMSKIFGELLMLIERDYRGIKATLAYNGLPFSVPKNLYIIGMMNTADRSLAMIDYALRRRFSFFEIEPGFDSEGFIHYQNGLNNETLNELVSKVKELNCEIVADKSLGKGFCIGHSYFCGKDVCTDEWLHSIVDYDILPMLSEYWFDDTSKLRRWENILQGMFQ